jgi:hypothetical protein
MKYGSPSFSVLLADGINLLAAKVKGVTYADESITEQTDGLGDGNEEHTPVGQSRWTLTQTGGFFDDAANGMHLAFRAASGASRILSFAYMGNAIGAAFVGALGAFTTKYEVLIQGGALTKANASYQISGEVEEGVILQHHVAKTADWNNEAAGSVDNGASSPDGGVGYQHVSAMTGFTGFVGKIRDSADDLTYADLITFANVPDINNQNKAQRIEVAGTVDRYLAYDGNVTGVGSITPFAGFARG